LQGAGIKGASLGAISSSDYNNFVLNIIECQY